MQSLYKIAIIAVLLFISAGLAIGQLSENVELVGRWAQGPCNAFAVRGDTVFVGNGSLLQVIDISTPATPLLVGEITVLNIIQHVAVNGNYACVIDNDYILRIINISNPSLPVEVGSFQTYDNIRDLAVNNGYAYVIDYYNGLRVIDITNPSNPYEVGYYNMPGYPQGLSLSGNYAYVASGGSGLRIINISNPASPSEGGYYDTPGTAQDVAVDGNYAYVADEYSGLRIINISIPSNPNEVGYYTTPGYAYTKVAVGGNCAYVRDNNGIRIINVFDPANPSYKSHYNTTHYIMDIYAYGNYAYYAESPSGLHILRVTPYSPSKVADYSSPGSALDVAVQGNFAYVADAGSGLRIINVTDPSSPTEEGYCIIPDESCQKVVVSGNYAYVLAGGLRIINISDPYNPYEQGSYATQEYLNDIAVHGSYVYLADGNFGMRIVNVSNPSNPTEESIFNISGGGTYIAVSGNYAYVMGMGVHIIDVSNPAGPYEVSLVDKYGVDLEVQGNYLYILDPGTVDIINVSNPANPIGEGVYNIPEGGWGYEIAVSGNYAHIANAQAGLYIINVSDPSAPTEAGYYENLVYAYAVAAVGDYSYVIDWDVGLYIIYFDADFQPLEEGYYFTPGYCYDIALSNNYAYVAASAGLGIINLANPSNPGMEGYCRLKGYWGMRAVKVRENYAYVAAGDSGLYIIDISNPANPFRVGYYDPPTGIYEGLALGEGFAYVASGNGLRIINISNPYNPSEVGYYAAGSARDVAVSGNFAYLAAESGGLRIINISDPFNPEEVGFYDTPGYAMGVALSGSYAYVADYQNGLRVINISEPSNPDEVGFYDSPGTAVDVKICGDYAYVADSDVNSGLRIINISDPPNPIIEGYFDTSDYGSAVGVRNPYLYLCANAEGVYIFRETIPPSAPENLTADGTSPSPWKNSPQFQINWTNPRDMSGITSLKYKIGNIPTSNNDFNGMVTGTPPQNVTISAQGLNTVYVWLVDSAGNENYNNYSNVILRYDASISIATNFSESHGISNNVWQNSINNPTFNWSAPSDLSGIDKYYIYFGANANGGVATDSTSNAAYTTTATQGTNYLRVQCKDNAGNIGEWTTGFIFRYDNTPPTTPTQAVEQNGTESDTWQNTIADPYFTWTGAGDNISAIASYWVYFGTEINGDPQTEVALPVYDPSMTINGTYYLRVKSEDLAGNQSTAVTLFIFKHDSQEPINPDTVTDITGHSKNNIWQNVSDDPNFSWTHAYDALSGVNGYYYYWGRDANGTSLSPANYLTANSWNATAVDTGITYLRIRTKDNVDNLALSWSTGYIFKFDNIKPSGSTASSPDTSAEETFTVSWSRGTDSGGSGVSGLYHVRYKENSGNWTDWQSSYEGQSAVFDLGTHDHTYSFEAAAIDSAGNEEDFADVAEYVTYIDTFAVDNIPPGKPENLTANATNPSPWKNGPIFAINWTNPQDMTGISKAYYKLDSLPTSNTDTTGSFLALPPVNISATKEGGQNLYLWLVDGRGNLDYLNNEVVRLRYDHTKPQGTQALSPDTVFSGNFIVSWIDGTDSGGSGLSGIFNVNVKDSIMGTWTLWLNTYKGQSAEFTTGEQGHTYYFEAAAIDSAGNIEDFIQIAECSTYVSPRLTIHVAQIVEEQSDSIAIEYSIFNAGNNPTSLKCQYSLNAGDSWYGATIVGDTVDIDPQNYQGNIIWNSYANAPGSDVDSARFKIIPYDNDGNGLPFITDIFHLDNNRIPSISIDPIPGEQREDITISFQLYDLENDTLDIICEYFDKNNQNWNSATIQGDITMITDYNNQITWRSGIDLPEVVDSCDFRVTAFDNDPGNSDTITILIDQIGAPVVISLSYFSEEQSGDVEINYELSDDENDALSLTCDYSDDCGVNWSNATISGMITDILPANYKGNLTWHSSTDLPGIDKNTIRLKVIPSDTHIGLAKVINDFHLDNNAPPLVNIGVINSPSSGTIKIPIAIEDSENDTISLTGMYSVASTQWQNMFGGDDMRYTSDNYSDTLNWNSIQDLGFGAFSEVQIQLIPVDNDSGSSSLSSLFDVSNYAGDYSGDIRINHDDLFLFSQAWYTQDLNKEIGPASGEPPLLIPQPDGKIDFEDLMVLAQQWNWSYDQTLLDKPFAKVSLSNTLKSPWSRNQISSIQKVDGNIEYKWQKDYILNEAIKSDLGENGHLIDIEQSTYNPWMNQFGNHLMFSLDTTVALLGFQIELEYDPSIITNLDIDNNLLQQINGFTFKGIDPKNGKILFCTIVLATHIDAISWEDGLFTLLLTANEESETQLGYSLVLYNIQGDIIVKKTSIYNLTAYPSAPQEYQLYQNFPNPFNPITTIRYQLPVEGKVKLLVYNILGQRVTTLVDDKQEAGYYSRIWDVTLGPQSLASGLYITRLQVQGEDGSRYMKSKKLLLIK